MNRFTLFLVIGCGVSTLSGCKVVAKVIGEAAAEVSEEVSTEALNTFDVEDQEVQALNSYVEGYNQLLDHPQRTIERYMKSVPESGPPGDKKLSLFLMEDSARRDLEEVKVAFSKGKHSADAEMKAMTEAADLALEGATKVIAAVSELQRYYSAEDYKDDAGAKAQKLHATFLAEFPKYQKNLAVLEQALDKAETKRSELELAGFDDKKSPSYLFRRYNFEAKRLLSKKDVAAFTKQFSEVDRLYTEVESVAKTDAAGPFKAGFQSYSDMAAHFHSAAKKVNRELKSEKPDPEKMARLREGLINQYNSCVSLANTLRRVKL